MEYGISAVFFRLMNVIITILGAPLRLLYSIIPNYAACLLLYLLIVRLLYIVFDYFRANQKVKVMLAKPFVAKIKDKFLGREGHAFEDATMEIFKTTGSNYFSTALPILFEYPVIIGLFFTVYHPISSLFPAMMKHIPAMETVAERICTSTFSEINIIRAVQYSPEAFTGFNISGIQNIHSSILGVNLFDTAKWTNITVALPILTMVYYLFVIIKMLVPVFKKEKKLRSVAPVLALYILVAFSICCCAFSMPLIFYCYLFIFLVIGSLANKIIDRIVYKRKKDWVKSKNRECQEILKKYGVEEYVSAIPEPEREI